MGYSEKQKVWNDTTGEVVRALLNLKNDAGAFLWFSDVYTGEHDTVGDIVEAMLLFKIKHLREL